MKPRYMFWMLVCTAGLIAFLTSGCYTQFGSTRDEGAVGYENEEDEYAYGDSVATTEDYNTARERFYDDNYYPGYGFGVGFYDPWAWNYGFGYGYGYGSYWYDPYWGWCGTSYPYYSAWWSRPVYGHRSSLYYGPVARGGSGYMGKSGGAYGSSRTFGSTRSAGGVRGGSGYTSGGTRSGSYGTAHSVGTYQTKPRASTGTAIRRTERPVRVNSSSSSRVPSREATRSYPRSSGNGRESGRSVRTYSPPPSSSGNSGRSSNGRGSNGGGGRSGGGTSTSAPSSPPPSSAPHSGGGSAPANTGSRGGNRR